MTIFNKLFYNSSSGAGQSYGIQHAFDKKLSQAVLLTVGFVAVTLLLSDPAFAATTTGTADVMSAAHTKVSELIKGSFAKIIAAVSLVFGLIGCVIRFNAAAIASCFGVGIAAGVGPAIVESLVSATF